MLLLKEYQKELNETEKVINKLLLNRDAKLTYDEMEIIFSALYSQKLVLIENVKREKELIDLSIQMRETGNTNK